MKRPTFLKGAERNSGDMTFADHLRELRYRLLIACGSVFLLMIPAWFLYPWFIDVLQQPYCAALLQQNAEANCDFLVINPIEPLGLRLRIAGYGGLLLAMPIIMWQLWRFIAPGLYSKERRYAMAFTASALVLFTMGAVMAYYTMVRALEFLMSVGGQDLDIRSGPGEFVRLAMFMMLAFGVGFEFPVVLVALQMIGVVTPQRLASWRRQTALVIVVVAAAITPSGDPFTLAALSVPMYLFYELSILIGRLIVRRKSRTRSVTAGAATATTTGTTAEKDS